MRQAVRIILIVILIGIVGFILYQGWERPGSNQFEAAFNPGGKVTLDLSAGGYTIQGTTNNKIRVEIDSHENREVQCRMNVSGSDAKIAIDGPSNNFKATIYVPQRTDLNVDQTIGELIVSNVEGNKHLGLNIGRIQVEVPNTDAQPEFNGSVIIGDLQANAWGIEKGGFFRSYSTHSSSPYWIKAHVDIGDLEVDAQPTLGDSHAQQSSDTDKDVSDKDSDDDTE
ncbi:MAG TPA: hypothetical protein VG897_15235 [Terriglobales bacterium]|nr:hypothetical protein [Terriglobales bacterium]